jgi:hypothetical protein
VPGVPFTKENAREMQIRAEASKRARAEELRATNEALRAAIESAPEFREAALMRVRAQASLVLNAIDIELDKGSNLDHKALTSLAATLATFESIEQKLSMRAGPGNLKPSAPRKPRAGSFQPPAPADDDGQA